MCSRARVIRHEAREVEQRIANLRVFPVDEVHTIRGDHVAVMQIVVYTGAIMVLFIFVIMLLNVGAEQRVPDRVHVVKYFGLPLAGLLIVEIGLIVSRAFSNEGISVESASINLSGNTQMIGKALYTQYALPFEVTSILLLVAIVGAIVMAKKEL